MRLKLGDVCAGIGGFSLAAKMTGKIDISWQIEIDKFCQDVLNKNFPEAKKYGDINKIEDGIDKVDIITAGVPCQPYSLAGKRSGESDERHLWPKVFALIKQIRPGWIIIENVLGAVSLLLPGLCDDLESENYTQQSYIIPACSTGALHRRNRLFVVAYSDRIRLRGSISPDKIFNEEDIEETRSKFAGINKFLRIQGTAEPIVLPPIHGIPGELVRPKNHRKMIHALGNAVMPNHVYPILQSIVNIMDIIQGD
jgi:DNA (cytosine-5)-methyltransferase 1